MSRLPADLYCRRKNETRDKISNATTAGGKNETRDRISKASAAVGKMRQETGLVKPQLQEEK